MNNLTTRKIVLGLLMTLVLAFSVQGTANAITLLARVSGDLQPPVLPDGVFSVTFSAALQNQATVNANYQAVPSNHAAVQGLTGNYYYDSSLYYVTAVVPDPNPNNLSALTSRYIISEANAFHYNQEAVTISVSGALITVAGGSSITPAGSHTLTEDDGLSDANNNGSNVVTCVASGAGEVTITITDATPNGDLPGGTSDHATAIAFTVYVVEPVWRVNRTAILSLRDITNGVADGYFPGNDQPIYSGDRNHYEVTYTVTPATDGGGVYVKKGTRLSHLTPQGSLTASSGATVVLRMGAAATPATRRVTVKVNGTDGDAVSEGLYIYGNPTLDIVTDVTDNQTQTGNPGAVIAEPFTVTVKDGRGIGVPGVPVKFDVRDKGVTSGGTLIFDEDDATLTGELIDARNVDLTVTRQAGSTIYVQTGAGGVAGIDFQLGSASGEQLVDVSAVGFTKTLKATTTFSEATRTISVHANRSRSGNPNIFDLTALVENGGEPDPGEKVTFRETLGSGTLTNTATGQTIDGTADTAAQQNGKQVTDITDVLGRAQVTYDAGGNTGRAEVKASISVMTDTGVTTHLKEIAFSIRGGGTRGPSGPSEPSNTITISPSTIDGEPGEEVTINVTSSPSGVFATLGSNDFGATRFSPQSDVTPFTSTLLLPVEEGTHSFFATGGVLTAGRASVTVETGILGTISISQIGTPSNGAQSFSITVVDTDSTRISGSLTVRVSGSGFTTRNVDTLNGIGNARLTLPTAASLYTLTASAEGYTSGTTQVRIAGTGQQQVADEDEEEVEEEVTVAAVPDSISIIGPSTRSGTVNEELDTPLLVRVLDDDGDGLEGARVFYRVISGRGRLSARGNGRAIGVVTDSSGYARAVFTPLDGGTITVRANTDDLSATVTFTITTGSAPSASGARDSGTGGTPGTISPVVHVGAASRPPMLWVDGGAIYALVGASPQRFASGVDNALNIAVAGGKVYWTEKTGESGGTINSANLNGSGVTELASIFATPMGIAVDVTNSKLYWTNSAGRIQSANLNGSRITNVIPGGLESPMDLALAGGNAYWTQGNGSVRFVNLRGRQVVRDISTGTDTPGSLVIGGGKVYWTETTGESGGTVNSANLNGTGATQLASILAAPMGIAVDGSRSKLYWSNARGRIQSANLDGSKIQNVVSGLGSPSELVLSNSIAAPTAATTTTRTTTTASKYDLNSDGTVDNTDAGLVADAMGTSNARYDVNGDGTVNFLDLLLVFDNRDAGAAGAPTVVGMKLSAIQIDRIEEQIDLLIATNDRSPAAMRVLVYLQQLLVTARPEKTQLLANYPNPFNPETWIPYELATDTNVRLTIYNTQGVVIRTLQFGHQSAGYYTGRDRAAYWDGRNSVGEQVASGLYFYQLETDEMSLMRKMVILK